jgi:SAM-dependent methyltransferase
MLYRDDLALIHHEGFGDFARRAGPSLLRGLRAAGLREGRVVDLGCGSGIWLRQLSDAGYETWGCDQSSAMLALAKQTAPQAQLVEGRADRVALPSCVAITALGEVLSYIPARGARQNLPRLFARAFRALCPGGLFVFDLMVTTPPPRPVPRPRPFRTWRGGKTWAVMVEIREDRDHGRIERHITTFRKPNPAVGYRRDEEVHMAALHEPRDILTQLRAAGFRARSSKHYGTMALTAGRCAFWARKPR